MKVEEIITNQILDYLKQGEIPWKQPWLSIPPQNFATKRPYTGINFLLLSLITRIKNYKVPYYLTFKQASDLGGKIKKGEKSIMVVFWDIFETEAENKKGELVEKKIPYVRYYNVFNVEQCEGLKVEEPFNHQKDENYEDVLKLYKDIPLIQNGDRASYSPSKDTVTIPLLNRFKRIEDYYATLYHELVHSTGSEKRLKRFTSEESTIFGSEVYSKEELLAELGSAFLCARHSIDNRLVENSAGYIQSWLKALKNDPKMIIIAAGRAQKAVNYMLGEGEAKKSLKSKLN